MAAITNLVSDEVRLQPGALVGCGLTSQVYAWGETQVLKLFLPSVTLQTVERELVITQAVHASGVSVPRAFEIVRVESRHGIVFERVHGPSLLRKVEQKPWTLFAAARELAELHARLHLHRAPPELPACRERMEKWIHQADSREERKQAALRQLAQTPPGDRICHGDFHPANIILSGRGPVIIDWTSGTRGHALADVACTSVLFERASLPPGAPLQIRLLMLVARRLLHASYLRAYLRLRPGTMAEIEKWRAAQRVASDGFRAGRRKGHSL